MKRQDVLIAEALAASKPDRHDASGLIQWEIDVNAVSDALEYADKSFKRQHFFNACMCEHAT